MTQNVPISQGSAEDYRKKALALDLLAEHAEQVRRLDRAGHHVIVAAWNAGLTERGIADGLECSRGPVRTHLHAAEQAGELHRSWRRGPRVQSEAGASLEAAEG